MSTIRDLREQKRWSQQHLAHQLGISVKRLSELETGLALPKPGLASEIERIFSVQGIATSQEILSERAMRRLARTRRFQFEKVTAEPWRRAETYYTNALREMKAPPQVVAWMKRHLPSDAASEILCYCEAAANGAKPLFANPHQCGFRDLCIVDRWGAALGERLLPALSWKSTDLECILWPQVDFHCGRRVDFLVIVRISGKSIWCVVEIDGPSHTEEADVFRKKLLRVDVVSISTNDVKGRRFLKRLAEEMRLLALGDKATRR